MKKAFFAVCLCVSGFFMAGNAAAEESPLGLTGFGVFGNFGTSMGGGIGLSFKWDSFPVVGLKYNTEGSQFNISADYYAVDAEPIGKQMSYFLGAGVYAGVNGSDDTDPFNFGFRIPAGIQFWPVKKLEVYLSPVISISLLPEPQPDLGVEFGTRIRF
jgi:hypothetical protein